MTTADLRARRPRRRLRLAAAAATLATVGVAGPLAAPATAAPQAPSAPSVPSVSWYEIDLYHRMNGVRWLSGGSPIWWHDALSSQASAWSAQMSRTGQLSHHPNLTAEANAAQSGWSGYAEIVGRGPDLASVLQAFLSSPPHREKLLGQWSAMGVGVVESGGQLWVTVRFIR